jgi:hypothetical protein
MEENREMPQEVVKMTAGQRVVALVTAPSELMENIKAHPVILAPFLVALVIGLVSVFSMVGYTQILMREQENAFIVRFPEAESPPMFSGGANYYGEPELPENVMSIVLFVTHGFGAAVNPFFISVFATLGLFILSKIFRGKTTFGQMFSMYMHVYIILALGVLVTTTIAVLTGNFVDMTSLAAVIMPRGSMDDAMFHLLSAIAIFPVWGAALTFFGVKVLNGFSNVKAGIVAVIAYCVYIGVHVVSMMVNWCAMDIMYAAGAL